MDERDYVLTMRCVEFKSEVVRHVSPVALTYEKLRYFYDKLKEFEVLFSDELPNDFISFAGRFLHEGRDGLLVANGLIWEVDDVGIVFMTGITDYSAVVHFTFWDRKFKGREDLLREMLRYGMERFGFERFETRIGLYAKGALYAVERIGFVKEGRLRKVTRYKGEWFDANIYSVLREEVLAWPSKMDPPVSRTTQLDSSSRSLTSSQEVKLSSN
jgi:RimJ/RimL family protein N-acetyltransferase